MTNITPIAPSFEADPAEGHFGLATTHWVELDLSARTVTITAEDRPRGTDGPSLAQHLNTEVEFSDDTIIWPVAALAGYRDLLDAIAEAAKPLLDAYVRDPEGVAAEDHSDLVDAVTATIRATDDEGRAWQELTYRVEYDRKIAAIRAAIEAANAPDVPFVFDHATVRADIPEADLHPDALTWTFAPDDDWLEDDTDPTAWAVEAVRVARQVIAERD